jgi:Trypsin-co-occurring domain 1
MASTETLVPVRVRDHTVYLAAHVAGGPGQTGHEVEVSARRPALDDLLDGVTAFAEEIVDRLREVRVSKVTVEFGCEVAVESGGFVAVIGKASGKSSIKVGLEWTRPAG